MTCQRRRPDNVQQKSTDVLRRAKPCLKRIPSSKDLSASQTWQRQTKKHRCFKACQTENCRYTRALKGHKAARTCQRRRPDNVKQKGTTSNQQKKPEPRKRRNSLNTTRSRHKCVNHVNFWKNCVTIYRWNYYKFRSICSLALNFTNNIWMILKI